MEPAARMCRAPARTAGATRCDLPRFARREPPGVLRHAGPAECDRRSATRERPQGIDRTPVTVFTRSPASQRPGPWKRRHCGGGNHDPDPGSAPRHPRAPEHCGLKRSKQGELTMAKKYVITWSTTVDAAT